jgi:TolB protein
MTDLGRTLEREMDLIRPSDYPVEAVARRRDRRRRRQRIGSAAVALSITAVAVGWTAVVLRERQDAPPLAPPLTGRIAFIDRESRLRVVDAAGGQARIVVGAHAEYPDWSPDGATIAFDDGQNLNGSLASIPNGRIYTVGADGSDLVEVPMEGHAFAPSWAPDGTRLAVAAERPGSTAGIAWLDLASGATTSVTTNPYDGYWDAEPDVSPDGTRIVFVRIRELLDRGGHRNRTALYVVHADGSGLRRLTSWGLDAGTPSWSPDGSRIAFSSLDHAVIDRPSQVFLIDPDGSNLTRLTSGRTAASFWPAWSPDGSMIVFTRFVLDPPAASFELAGISVTGEGAPPLPASIPAGANQADWGRNP